MQRQSSRGFLRMTMMMGNNKEVTGMKTIELIKGLSYRGKGVNAVKGTPLKVNDEKAEALVASGFFRCVSTNTEESVGMAVDRPADMQPEQPETPVAPAGNQETLSESFSDKLTADKIDGLKMPELIALAESNGIDISGCKNNEERKAVLKEKLSVPNPFAE